MVLYKSVVLGGTSVTAVLVLAGDGCLTWIAI